MNIFSFGVMFIDKKKAIDHDQRISEGMMFFLATILGSIGIYLGMFVFRHKNRKWYFLLGIPLLAIENFSFIYIIYHFLLKDIVI